MLHISRSEKDTRVLGEKYGNASRGGEVFLLIGELGGGKTQFAKGLASGLGVSEEITSPTFNYENIYQGKALTVYHFDLYREKELDPDIEALLSEAISDKNGVTVVEWAQYAKELWPTGAYIIDFEWSGETERTISVSRKK